MKYEFYIPIFILCFVNLGYAQDSIPTSIRTIEFNFSPNYNYRVLSFDPSLQGLVNAREKHENPSFGFNFGVFLNTRIVDRLKFGTGIQFVQEGSQFIDVPIAPDSGLKPGIVNTKYNYSYVEIPLKFKYSIIIRSVKFNWIVGFAPKYLVDNRNINDIEFDDGQTDMIIGKNILMDPNKFNVNALVGIGTQIRIDETLLLNIEPMFRYALRALAKNPIKQFNYSIGLNIGIESKI